MTYESAATSVFDNEADSVEIKHVQLYISMLVQHGDVALNQRTETDLSIRGSIEWPISEY
jgi:hypothetical protein